MNVLVLGDDGVCGLPTALHLSAACHDVSIVDNPSRCMPDLHMGLDPITFDAGLKKDVTEIAHKYARCFEKTKISRVPLWGTEFAGGKKGESRRRQRMTSQGGVAR